MYVVKKKRKKRGKRQKKKQGKASLLLKSNKTRLFIIFCVLNAFISLLNFPFLTLMFFLGRILFLFSLQSINNNGVRPICLHYPLPPNYWCDFSACTQPGWSMIEQKLPVIKRQSTHWLPLFILCIFFLWACSSSNIYGRLDSWRDQG